LLTVFRAEKLKAAKLVAYSSAMDGAEFLLTRNATVRFDRSEKDVDEIPQQVLKNVTLIKVEHMDEVLKHALVLPDPDTFFKSRRSDQKNAAALAAGDRR
jgi:Lon protease (S16) C-terminal proteolytic domain